MSRADGIIKRLDKVLSRLNVTDRVVSKRITKSTGGDPLLGRGSTASTQDTVLDPQPSVRVASAAYPMVLAGQAMAQDAEYLMNVSASAMTRAEVTDPAMSIVFTGDAGVEEELFIIGFSTSYLNGTDIAFSLVLASKRR